MGVLLALVQDPVLILDQSKADAMHDASPYMWLLPESEDCNTDTVPDGQCDALFRPLESRYSNYIDKIGFVWVKMRVRRDIPSSFVFNIEEPTLPQASIYALINDTTLYERHISDRMPMSERPVQSLEPVFVVTSELGVETTVYLRLRVVLPKNFSIQYGTPQAFLYSMQRKYLWNGLYFGAMLIMGLYNLFIWFTVRDRAWLYYSMYVFFFALAMAYSRGFGFLYFWPEWPAVNLHPNVLTGWVFLAALAFSSNFLNLKEQDRPMYRAVQAFIFILIALMVASLIGYRYLGVMATQYVTLTGSVVLLFAGYRSYSRGYRPARIYLIAWSVVLTSAIVFVLAVQGIIHRNTFTIGILQVGSVIEMLLLSYALADRINMYRAESQELQSLNDLKTRLFSVVSHDVRYPLASLTMLLDLHESGDLTPEERTALLADVRRSLNTSSDMLDGVLQWSSSQMRQHREVMQATPMQAFVDEHIKQIQPSAKRKNLVIRHSVAPSDLVPYIDHGLASLAMRNLLTNAVKFTENGGTVDIEVKDGNTHVHISVTDTGVGMSEEAISMLYANKANPASSGTDREPGAGLGLILLRHMLEASGGALHVHSERGVGSRFTVDISKGRPRG